jgi:predicted PurR-regulated permease PerM
MSSRLHPLVFWTLLCIAFCVFAYHVNGILLPFVIGGVVAYLLSPLVDRLERKGLPRTLGTAVVLIPFLALVTSLFFILIPMLENQLLELIRVIPQYAKSMHELLVKFIDNAAGYLSTDDLQSLRQESATYFPEAVRWGIRAILNILSSGLVLANILSLMVIMPIVAFYLLRDWHVVWNSFSELFPRKYEAEIREQFYLVDQRLSGFIRGQALVCMILGAYYGTSLGALGLEFGALIGILTGCFAFIPYIAVITGFFVSLIIALSQFGSWYKIGSVVCVFAIGSVLEGGFLTPKLVGDRVGLHPLWIIFALLSGGILLGLKGFFLAVPIASILGVFVRFFVNKYIKSSYYTFEPLPSKSVKK